MRTSSAAAPAPRGRFLRPSKGHGKTLVDALLHPIVRSKPPPPARERRRRVPIVRRHRDQRLVGPDRELPLAHAVLNLSEQGARLRQLRVELERALELVARLGVAPFERRRHAGAKVELRVPGIGGNGAAEGFGRGAGISGCHSIPAAALEQRVLGIDLSRCWSGQHRQAQQERG